MMVSMYDPAIDAYREVPIELAEKFIAEVENVKAAVAKAKGQAEPVAEAVAEPEIE